MKTKVLIATDLSENSLKAVEYVGGMIRCHDSARITLLHVIREPSPDIVEDEGDRRRYVENARTERLCTLEEIGSRLVALGVPEDRIRLKILVCRKPVSTAELILHEQEKGNYGTLVVGRRGISKREAFLFGSVSATVVREAKRCAVWVIA
jgi:nucleotide-binding universal stress UspA family protein